MVLFPIYYVWRGSSCVSDGLQNPPPFFSPPRHGLWPVADIPSRYNLITWCHWSARGQAWPVWLLLNFPRSDYPLLSLADHRLTIRWLLLGHWLTTAWPVIGWPLCTDHWEEVHGMYTPIALCDVYRILHHRHRCINTCYHQGHLQYIHPNQQLMTSSNYVTWWHHSH